MVVHCKITKIHVDVQMGSTCIFVFSQSLFSIVGKWSYIVKLRKYMYMHFNEKKNLFRV